MLNVPTVSMWNVLLYERGEELEEWGEGWGEWDKEWDEAAASDSAIRAIIAKLSFSELSDYRSSLKSLERLAIIAERFSLIAM